MAVKKPNLTNLVANVESERAPPNQLIGLSFSQDFECAHQEERCDRAVRRSTVGLNEGVH
jgi:hypothetical protein